MNALTIDTARRNDAHLPLTPPLGELAAWARRDTSLVVVLHVRRAYSRGLERGRQFASGAPLPLDAVHYEAVALVETVPTGRDGGQEDVADLAWMATQSVDAPWTAADNVRLLGEAALAEGVRSSCTGDVFLVEGEPYLCEAVGFTHLGGEAGWDAFWAERGKEEDALQRTHCDAGRCGEFTPCIGCQARRMNNARPGSGTDALRKALGSLGAS